MTNETFDVAVIGSGFGGAVAANRLALAGKRVLVLERGPWRDSLPVRAMGVTHRSPYPYGWRFFTHALHSLHGRRFSWRFNRKGMFELGVFSGLYTLAASGVGGGSTAYGGMLEPPRNPDLWRDRHPQLVPAAIEAYYEKILADMGAVRVSREHPTPHSIWKSFPDENDVRCRPAEVQPRFGTLIPTTAGQVGTTIQFGPAQLPRKYCAFDGDSFLGSLGGAKASVDFVYLAPVLNKGVTVRDMCEVSSIKPVRGSQGAGYELEFKDLSRGRRERIVVPRVVLAAGTLNTLRLLFAGVRRADGLAPMPALGQKFFGNGDLVGVWVNSQTPTPSYHSAPSLGELAVQGHESKPIGLGGLPGVDALPLPRFVKRWLGKMFYVYGMGIDSAKATVSYVNGRLRSDYDYRREPVYAELRAAFGIVEQVSGRKIHALNKPLTPHMAGGARIGASAQEGVVDHRGEVYGNPGLFVADASVLPAPPGGAPSLAIAAWAHHVADHLFDKP